MCEHQDFAVVYTCFKPLLYLFRTFNESLYSQHSTGVDFHKIFEPVTIRGSKEHTSKFFWRLRPLRNEVKSNIRPQNYSAGVLPDGKWSGWKMF